MKTPQKKNQKIKTNKRREKEKELKDIVLCEVVGWMDGERDIEREHDVAKWWFSEPMRERERERDLWGKKHE